MYDTEREFMTIRQVLQKINGAYGITEDVIIKQIRDLLFAFPNEAMFLREAIMNGNVDGRFYWGECKCPKSLIAWHMGLDTDDYLESENIEGFIEYPTNPYRPDERLFAYIHEGDTHVNSDVSRYVLTIIDAWINERSEA